MEKDSVFRYLIGSGSRNTNLISTYSSHAGLDFVHSQRYLIRMADQFFSVSVAESFYNVKYEPSIIKFKSWSNNLSNENINTGISVFFKTKRALEYQN